MPAHIRQATPADAELVFAFIHELAVYERLEHEVSATPALIGEALFAPAPRVFCDIIEWVENGETKPAGFALWFYNFSTFNGHHGIYLEDLFVRPEFRGLGLGKLLLKNLGARCEAEGLKRLQWQVLDWNAPSIAFYRGLGAKMMEDWTGCKVEGDALRLLALN